jgi:hypothetical protein
MLRIVIFFIIGASASSRTIPTAPVFLKIRAVKRLQGELSSSVVPLRGTTDEDSGDASPLNNCFKMKMLYRDTHENVRIFMRDRLRRKRGCALPHAAFGGVSALRPMITDFRGNQ